MIGITKTKTKEPGEDEDMLDLNKVTVDIQEEQDGELER